MQVRNILSGGTISIICEILVCRLGIYCQEGPLALYGEILIIIQAGYEQSRGRTLEFGGGGILAGKQETYCEWTDL